MQLTFQNKNEITRDKWLSSDHMDAVHQIWSRQFQEINGFQSTLLTPFWNTAENCWTLDPERRLRHQTPPCVQIHHNGKNHWQMSYQQSSNSKVYLLDSLPGGQITPSLQIQLALIYGAKDKKLQVKSCFFQHQGNGHDCGVYAIAAAVEVCFGNLSLEGKNQWRFNSELLRPHLLKCLQQRKFTPFPKLIDRLCKRTLKTECIMTQCCCHLPNIMEDMTACDRCKLCYHNKCLLKGSHKHNGRIYCFKCQ